MSRKTRKLIWSAPLVAVLAVAGALAIFVALTPDPAEAHGPPGPVTGISATASGYDTINVAWNKPDSDGDVTGYRIDYSVDSYAWKALVPDTGDTKTTYKDPDLKPETTRYYRVFAMNSAGSSPVSTDESYAFATTGGVQAPGPVRNLVATRGAGKIDLTWTAPADNGGAKIARYCIVAAEIGTDLPEPPDSCTTATDSDFTDDDPFIRVDVDAEDARELTVVTNSDKTEYEHKTLDATIMVGEGQQWAFQVYAVNMGTPKVVSSTASNRATATVGQPAAAQKPATPTNLKAVQTAVATVSVYWNETRDVAAEDAGDVIEYELRTSVYDPTENEWGVWAESDLMVTPNSATLHGATAPTVTANEAGTAKVRYRVRYKAVMDGAPASDWSNVATVPLYDTNHTLSEVEPVLDDANLRDVTQRSSYNTIQLSWMRDPNMGHVGNEPGFDEPGDLAAFRPTGYVIDYRDASKDAGGIYSSWRRLQSNTGYSRTYYYHRGLEHGSHIEYRIFPWHRDRFGTPQTIEAMTKSAVTPDPVRGLMVAADGPDKLTVTWPAVTNTGGSPITGYRIEVAVSDTGTDWPATIEKADNDATDAPVIGTGVAKSVGANTTTYTYTDDDLVSGSTLWFRVFALNVQNDEDDETGSVTTTGLTMSDVASAEAKKGTTATGPNPMAPQDLTSELAKTSSLYTFGQTGVLLLWNTAKESRSYDPVVNYEVQRMVNDGDWEDLVTTTSMDTFSTDEDLPVTGEMRAYRVRSVTASDKVSPWSNVTYFPGMHGMDTAHVMASGSIMDQTVVEGMSLDAMDVSGYFTVTEGITYTAMSSDDTIATASIPDGSNMLTIMGVAQGSATITVTATDAAGAYAMQTIAVTVNAVPMAVGEISAVMVTEGMMSDAMDVSGYFSDTAGDTLTYTAMSSDDMVATASVDGSMVTITGVAAGMATITVTATDAAGAYAMQTIMVTVEAANTVPMAVGMIAPVTVTAGEMSDAMDVSAYFSDADMGDTLKYTAMSDMEMYATAEVDDMGMLTITGVAAGMATITVTATDMAGAYAMQTIMVTVEAADTTLGNAMGLTATAGSSGDVVLTWTPGTNATIHWIAGVRVINGAIDPSFTPIWHAAGGHGTHTVNAPTAGDYVFAVIAGQTSGGTTEWSSWITQRYTHQ